MTFTPGQKVIITGSPGRPTVGRSEGTVKTVGRALVHVDEGGRTLRFRIDSGWQDGQYRHRRVWTPEGLAASERSDELKTHLRALHVDVGFGAGLTIDQLAAILAIVEGTGDVAVVDGIAHQLVEIPDGGWRTGEHDGDTGLRMGGTPGVRPVRTEPVYRLAPLAGPKQGESHS